MNIAKMTKAIEKGHAEKRWGVKLSDQEHFYRMLFKYEQEKQKKLEYSDVQHMFASFCNWQEQITTMIAECEEHARNNDGCEEDAKAIRYANCLTEDILNHMHRILTKAETYVPTDLLEELLKYAEAPQQ